MAKGHDKRGEYYYITREELMALETDPELHRKYAWVYDWIERDNGQKAKDPVRSFE